MGSVASYGVSLELKTERTLEISGTNTESEVEALIEELGQPPLKEVTLCYEDVETEKDNYMYFTVLSEYGERISSLDSDSVEDFLTYADGFYAEIEYFGVRAYTLEEMKKLDLLILREYALKKKPVPNDVNTYEQIASGSESIYCSNDNSFEVEVELTPDTLRKLEGKNVTLILSGDGSGDNC